MENIFDKFKKLNLDTSPIGLSIELREPFFVRRLEPKLLGGIMEYIIALSRDLRRLFFA